MNSARPATSRSTSSALLWGEPRAQTARVAEAQVAGGFEGVEGACRGVDADGGEEVVGALGGVVSGGQEEGGGPVRHP
ncbi:hypothetical protein [Streptomyces sp. NRRL F-2799]|uniref:hypothetical protein n=1 Tax=Streptomyces sp. NRRL F-2799 TaxID=1463844 RepID=UPI00131A4B25